MNVSAISSQDISPHIKEFMSNKALITARRYTVILARIFKKAVEWDYITKSPMLYLKKPSIPTGRERYLHPMEIEKLLEVCRYDKNENIHPMVVMAGSIRSF
jgi:integrase